MLIRFVVENFLSFKDETEFNMLTGQFKIHKDHIINLDKEVEVLKIGSLYGANGSGKSNLVKGIDFVKKSVERGEIDKSSSIPIFRLDKESAKRPTSFEVEFGYDKAFYSYGFGLLKNEIIEEWLVKLNFRNKNKEETIFERKLVDDQIEIEVNAKYLKTEEDKLLIKVYQNEILKKSQLFIKLISKKFGEAKKAYDWFNDHLTIIYPHSKAAFLVAKCVNEESFMGFANRILSTFSTGIEKLDIETIPFDIFFGDEDKELKQRLIEDIRSAEAGDEEKTLLLTRKRSAVMAVLEDEKPVIKKLISKHKTKSGEAVDFELEEESDGTQRLLDFIPAIEMVMSEEKVVFIDEIDQSIHPSLLKTFLKKLLENKESKGQFIFTTHESNLLDLKLFRQDEIWFVEKDEDGSTHLYPLSDYKPRYDLDVRKGYLKGRFGALPFLGNLKDLSWEEYA